MKRILVLITLAIVGAVAEKYLKTHKGVQTSK